MDKMIEVKHVSKSYGNKLSPVKVLDNISFTVEKGEFVGSWVRVVLERRL